MLFYMTMSVYFKRLKFLKRGLPCSWVKKIWYTAYFERDNVQLHFHFDHKVDDYMLD